jgi:hypothetical protein
MYWLIDDGVVLCFDSQEEYEAYLAGLGSALALPPITTYQLENSLFI